jgi:hypothetical protein
MSEALATTAIEEVIKQRPRTIRYYACGGTGINLLRSHREDFVLGQGDLLAGQEFFSYIDTSFANLHNVPVSSTFTLKGVDGSGSDRPRNAAAIKKLLPDILLAHEPKDLNVFLFAASGGSGSVAGPLLLEELLSQGKMCVSIVIGSHETLKRTTNVISTLKGLEQAVNRLERPIVMFYHENDQEKSLIANNLTPKFVLGSMALLGSGRNKGLDSADVGNLFDFHNVTHNAPGLAMLDVFNRAEDIKKTGDRAIAYIALMRDEDSVIPRIDADYDKAGFLPSEVETKNDYFFTVSVGNMTEMFDRLNGLKDKVALKKKTQQATTKLSDSKTAVDETGLVFE